MKSSRLRSPFLRASVLPLLLLGLALPACSSSGKKKPQSEEEEDDSSKGRLSADTPELELLDFAMSYYDRGSFSLAREAWTALTEGHPGSYYVPLAELKIADSQFYGHNYPEAIIAYEEFIKSHPAHEAVPYARFQIGTASFNQHSDTKRDQAPLKQSIKAYRALLEAHSASAYVTVAQQNIKRAREMLASYEAYVAEFYLKQGAVEPAFGRYSRLMGFYPDSDVAKERSPQIKMALLAAAPDNAARARFQKPIARRKDSSTTSPDIIVSNLALLNETDPVIDEDSGLEDASLEEHSAEDAPVFAKHEPTVSADKKGADSAPISISCQENMTNSVFVVSIPSRPQIVSEQRDNSGQLHVEFSAEGVALRNSEPPARCETKNASVLISDAEQNGVLSARVTNLPGSNVTGFALDRPGRVVLVVSNPHQNS